MKINASELQHALESVSHALPTRGTIPAIDGICFRAGEITATNLEQTATVSIDHGLEVDAILPAKLVEIVSTLNGEVEISADENFNISVISGKSKFKLHGHSAEDFPRPQTGESIGEYDLTATQLQQAVNSVGWAASVDSTRPAFNGVLFNGKLIASDTYRLAIYELDVAGPCLVPSKFLQHVKKLNGSVLVSIYESALQFTSGDLTLTTQLLNENYPEIANIIPKQQKTLVTVGRDELANTIRRAALLTTSKDQVVTIDISEAITVSVNSEQGSMTETITAEVKGEPVDIHLNAKFILDVLKIAPESVKIKLHGEGGPVVFEWEKYLYLVLPIKKVN